MVACGMVLKTTFTLLCCMISLSQSGVINERAVTSCRPKCSAGEYCNTLSEVCEECSCCCQNQIQKGYVESECFDSSPTNIWCRVDSCPKSQCVPAPTPTSAVISSATQIQNITSITPTAPNTTLVFNVTSIPIFPTESTTTQNQSTSTTLEPKPRKVKQDGIYKIIVPVFAAALVFAVIVFIWRRKKKQKSVGSSSDVRSSPNNGHSTLMTKVSNDSMATVAENEERYSESSADGNVQTGQRSSWASSSSGQRSSFASSSSGSQSDLAEVNARQTNFATSTSELEIQHSPQSEDTATASPSQGGEDLAASLANGKNAETVVVDVHHEDVGNISSSGESDDEDDDDDDEENHDDTASLIPKKSPAKKRKCSLNVTQMLDKQELMDELTFLLDVPGSTGTAPISYIADEIAKLTDTKLRFHKHYSDADRPLTKKIFGIIRTQKPKMKCVRIVKCLQKHKVNDAILKIQLFHGKCKACGFYYDKVPV